MKPDELANMLEGRRVGLALGGGSARGWAHIGVIECLEDSGVSVHCVAGTSIGALVGGFAAARRIALLREIAENLDWMRFLRLLDVTFPRSGLVDGRRIVNFVRDQIGTLNIEDLSLPYAAVAADLFTGEEVLLKHGDLIEAIRASIAVPGIFTPVRRGNRLLADGGLVDPVPVSAARKLGADFVIAVDLNHDIVNHKAAGRKGWFGLQRVDSPGPADSPRNTLPRDGRVARILERLNLALDTLPLGGIRKMFGEADAAASKQQSQPNVLEVIMAAVVIMTEQITQARLKVDRPDLVVRPALGHINFFEFHRAQESIEAGKQAFLEAVEQYEKPASTG